MVEHRDPDEQPRPSRSVDLLVIAIGVALLLGGALAATYTLLERSTGDISNPEVEFRDEPAPRVPPKAARRPKAFVWRFYGYDAERRRFLDAPSKLRPPFRTRWRTRTGALLEFPPVMKGGSLYQLANDGDLFSFGKRTGRVRWRRNLGRLAASSPAIAQRKLFVTLLRHGGRSDGGRIVALDANTGAIRWAKRLAGRSESSPVVSDDGVVYFGTENKRIYAMRASDGRQLWVRNTAGAVKGGPALRDGVLYVGDYAGHVYAWRARNGRKLWEQSTSGAALGFGAGSFYSTPAVAFGRVYLGNTDGRVYSFAARTGKLAWAKKTGNYVYASPSVGRVPRLGPTVYIGSYDGHLYALDARSGGVRWRASAEGRVNGPATVIGSIVYVASLGAKQTFGYDARTGKRVWRFPRGAYAGVVSDGQRLYVSSYSALFALVPK